MNYDLTLVLLSHLNGLITYLVLSFSNLFIELSYPYAQAFE